MTLAAPAFLAAAAVVSVLLVALHFLATKQPETSPLPTIRFVPERDAAATTRAFRPSHLLLLALRVLIVMAIGAALARPFLQRQRRPLARVVAVDLSRGTANPAEARDSALAALRDGDALIVYDSAARLLTGAARDSLAALAAAPARSRAATGSLSSALVVALREAVAQRDRADSMELVIVAPFSGGALDGATTAIRGRWPGRARLVRVAAAPVAPRGAGTTVDWAGARRPPRAIARARHDTVGAVVADQESVVAPFERRWEYPADSLRDARVTARWMDGAPAAIEWPVDSGCARSTVVARDTVGDLVLRPEFARLTTALGAPCAAGQDDRGPIPAPVLALLAGPARAAAADDFPTREGRRSPLAPWLLAVASVLVLAETLVRRRADRA